MIKIKEVEVAIIGGGPAGMTAAIELAAGGADVVVIDAYPQLGGHYFRQPPPEFGTHALTSGTRQAEFVALRDDIEQHAPTILYETSVWAIFPHDNHENNEEGFTLHITSLQHTMRRLSARYLLLAPGAYDRPMPFPGWHLPGVITLGGAQMMLKGHGIAPGKRILVAGGGPLLLAASAGLLKAGADVVAVLDVAGMTDGFLQSPFAFWGQWGRLREAWAYWRVLQRKRVPLKFRHAVFRALGESEVEGAVYGKLDAEGKPISGSEKTVEVDTICVALGFLPNIALTRHLKCEHWYDERLDAFYPQHDDTFETSVPNVFVAGDVTGVGGKDLSKIQGRVAAWHILHKLGRVASEDLKRRKQAVAPQIKGEKRFLEMMLERMRVKPTYLDLLDDHTYVCRCEMVTAGTLKRAIHDGAHHLRGAKLRTRCGMGACQSRYCEQTTAALIMRETGQPREAVGTSSIRPPLIPILAQDMLEASESSNQ